MVPNPGLAQGEARNQELPPDPHGVAGVQGLRPSPTDLLGALAGS